MRSVCRKLRFLPGVALALLAGCSTVVEKKPVGPLPSDLIVNGRVGEIPVEPLPSDLIVTGQMEDMMLYYDSLRKQTPPELARVYDKVKQNFVQNKSDANRARLILLLILPNTSFRDITSAFYLLNEWPRDAKPITGLQSFRNLLTALLAEQQRLTHNIEELSLKLKEEQKRGEVLQKQIEAIKSMEKNLILREM